MKPPDDASPLRDLPSIGSLLETPTARRLAAELAPSFLAACARTLLDAWRADVLAGRADGPAIRDRRERAEALLEAAVRLAQAPALVPVINATGVVVHTNLGRAPWPRAVAERALAVASRYSNLEYDLGRGERGARETHLERALALFGAEAALVVNNCAAAVLLILNTLAEGRETVVSRGELVEIGGSFRIPEVLAKSGSILREVGTTNRTRLGDYEAAISVERTGVLLKVHPSNYRVVGFTESVATADLAALGARHGIPVVDDHGTGDVVELAAAGVVGEPTVGAAVAAGVDLVAFSGDKLLGGPQAGIIVGRAAYVKRLKANPLYRALRPDKVTIAALAELLRIYAERDPWREVPILAAIAADAAGLTARCDALVAALHARGVGAERIAASATVGGGAAPLSALPGPAVAIAQPGLRAASLATALRAHEPPVIARVEDDRVIVDLRTVFPDEDESVLAALVAAAQNRLP